VGLAPERNNPVSTRAGLNEYARPVLKHSLTMAG
jgi:hypothetical protein